MIMPSALRYDYHNARGVRGAVCGWWLVVDCMWGGSVDVFRVGVGLLESCLAAFEHLLAQGRAVLRLSRVVLEAGHEGVVLGRALLLDDQHARRSHVLTREPKW